MRPRCLLAAVLMISAASLSAAKAHELSLNTSQEVYRPGDTISAFALITNTKEEPTSLSLEVLLKDLRSKVAPTLVRFSLSLAPRESRTIELFSLVVDQAYYSGPYSIQANLVEGRFVVRQAEAQFRIEGAPEDLLLDVILSRDPANYERTSVFIKNEKAFLAYSCSVQNPNITARLTFPDGSSREVHLPTNLTVKQVGSYSLDVWASKDGYRQITAIKQFAVLEADPLLLQSYKQPSHILLGITDDRIREGEILGVAGSIVPAHAEANVTLTYYRAGQIIEERNLVTDDEGRFSDTYQPSASGEWSVLARWTGDSNHLGTESESTDFEVEKRTPQIDPFLILIGGAIILLLIVSIALRARRR